MKNQYLDNSNYSALVLCGGVGSRLWPLSRRDKPKQFSHFNPEKPSLFENSILRLQDLGTEKIFCATTKALYDLAKGQFNGADGSGEFLIEPAAAGTGFAVIAGVVKSHIEGYSRTLVMPADQVVEGFGKTMQQMLGTLDSGEASICCVGFASEGDNPRFSSLRFSESKTIRNLFLVDQFLDVAVSCQDENFDVKGRLINTGIYLINNEEFLNSCRKFADVNVDDLINFISKNDKDSDVTFSKELIANNKLLSFDSMLITYPDSMAVVEHRGLWSAVESWSTFKNLTETPKLPNNLFFNPDDPKNYSVGGDNVFVHGNHRLIATAGVSDLIIVDTPDSLLVMDVTSPDSIKDLVDLLVLDDRQETKFDNSFERPWGKYEVLTSGQGFQVKKIIVNPRQKLSLQKHVHRCENWVVVAGIAEVEIEDEVRLLHQKESAFIPAGHKHRLGNPGPGILEVIEVQSGEYLGEDDIIRFEDGYGRT